MQPVGGEQEQQVGSLTVPLPGLEHGLLPRHDVAAVAVDERDPREAVSDEVVRQVLDEVEIDARRSRERAGEVAVVMRVAEPLQRREQALRGGCRLLHPADHLAEQERIGEHRHVPAVLLKCGDREDDGRGSRQGGDGRPRQVGKVHAAASGMLGRDQCSGTEPHRGRCTGAAPPCVECR